MGLFSSKSTEYIPRESWDAVDPHGSLPLPHPVQDVYLTAVEGHTRMRHVFYLHDCMRFLRELQKVQMYDEGMPDIAYNFYIGGDGNIFEGRGWHDAPTLDKDCFTEQPEVLAIAYIRPNPGSRPTKVMVAKAKEVINDGVERGYIDKNYTIGGLIDGMDRR